ncbi:hypothetical protein PM082_017116 [Marasmius tenuissimus]|nr:hypothetical protein PM082_017116 [Marasmius tenuissimus]
MDVVVDPGTYLARKKPPRKAVRANQQQLSFLRAAFAESPNNPMGEALQNLITSTGLTEQWIHNWFGRERQKKFGSKKITALKAEHKDPVLPDSSSNAISDSEVTDSAQIHSSPGPLKKKARGSRTKQTLAVKKENLESVLLPVEPSVISSSSQSAVRNPATSLQPSDLTDQTHIPALAPARPVKQAKRRQRKKPTASSATASVGALLPTVATENSNASQALLSVHAQTENPNLQSQPPPKSPSSELPVITLRAPKPNMPEHEVMAHLIPHSQPRLPPAHHAPIGQPAYMPYLNSYIQPPPANRSLPPLPDVLNPNLAPMKHLTALRSKVATGSIPMRSERGRQDLVSTLLDDQIAADDPFQATMGLVFLHRVSAAAKAAKKA